MLIIYMPNFTFWMFEREDQSFEVLVYILVWSVCWSIVAMTHPSNEFPPPDYCFEAIANKVCSNYYMLVMRRVLVSVVFGPIRFWFKSLNCTRTGILLFKAVLAFSEKDNKYYLIVKLYSRILFFKDLFALTSLLNE